MKAGEDKILQRKEIKTPDRTYILLITERYLGAHYPGMTIYTLRIVSEENVIALFRTNTYEYPPSSPISALGVLEAKSDEWTRELLSDPSEFQIWHESREIRSFAVSSTPEVLILQGSPRPAGNCSVTAGWARALAERAGRTAGVVYLDDLTIRACIGCYQCYNTGTCIFNDDMAGIIRAISGARVVIICSPVYTNTVPGSLKIVFDRCQAYHAWQVLNGHSPGKKGLLISVAGRKGKKNFTCVTRVVDAFMENIHIRPSGSVLIDDLDRIKDIRNVTGAEQKINKAVENVLE
ncbi:MAG: flavodoxin family protein [Methanoregulaceae archaeon]|nr:flavodoxin family protein [Methanoregulaceae archaeon]